IASAAVVGLRAPVPLTPGITYNVTFSATPVGEGPVAAAMEAQRAKWSAVAVFAKGRGRMDITEGGQPPMFATGDYLLSDSAEFIIVRPATKSFFGLSTGAARRMLESVQAMGMTQTFKDIKVSLDTLGAGETLDGH